MALKPGELGNFQTALLGKIRPALTMIPEEVCGSVIQWITREDEDKVRRAIRAYARERKLAGGSQWRMDYLGIRLRDIAKEAERLPDEVFAVEDIHASRENIILVMLFFP
ncbi:MAG: hypothetical protein ACU0GE_15020 [Pseudooceanicola nanhaiensis]|uniref:hypothetical protein n=1 Tax=Rhodobacterales TaxID=204455 RepID=UPI004057FAFE